MTAVLASEPVLEVVELLGAQTRACAFREALYAELGRPFAVACNKAAVIALGLICLQKSMTVRARQVSGR